MAQLVSRHAKPLRAELDLMAGSLRVGVYFLFNGQRVGVVAEGGGIRYETQPPGQQGNCVW